MSSNDIIFIRKKIHNLKVDNTINSNYISVVKALRKIRKVVCLYKKIAVIGLMKTGKSSMLSLLSFNSNPHYTKHTVNIITFNNKNFVQILYFPSADDNNKEIQKAPHPNHDTANNYIAIMNFNKRNSITLIKLLSLPLSNKNRKYIIFLNKADEIILNRDKGCGI